MEAEQRKREAEIRKREKLEQKRERERIRAELEKDKMERLANKGKLKSSLGVDGYNPSAIQYDQSAEGAGAGEPPAQKPKKSHADAGKIDEYISKVSSYRAGGDGGKCLKILKAYVGNVADNPDEEKFKKINMDNKGMSYHFYFISRSLSMPRGTACNFNNHYFSNFSNNILYSQPIKPRSNHSLGQNPCY